MLGVMSSLLNGADCTMLQLGLNSPIAADASQWPPLSLAVVVDTSGSMDRDRKIDFVRDGLGILIDGLADEDRFSLIGYAERAEVIYPMGEVRGNRVAIRAAVDALEAEGGTNLHHGLETGFRTVLAEYDSGRQNRVILLSDGNPTVGIQNPSAITEMSKGYNSDGIGLTTVGLGTDFNAALMRDLALQADGNFYFLEDSGAVSEVFDEELSFFTVPVAFDLKLSVRAGTEYEFGRAMGSPLWQDEAEGGVLAVPSVFLAHRKAADDVTAEGGRRGGGSALLLELMPRLRNQGREELSSAEVATVDVEFREPGSDEMVTDTVVVNYPRAPWDVPVEGHFENIGSQSTDFGVVTKSFIMLNIYAGIEGAVAAFNETPGEASVARAQLVSLLAALQDYNEEVQDTDIEFDIDLVQQFIDVMQDNRVPPPQVVDIPANPWPRD